MRRPEPVEPGLTCRHHAYNACSRTGIHGGAGTAESCAGFASTLQAETAAARLGTALQAPGSLGPYALGGALAGARRSAAYGVPRVAYAAYRAARACNGASGHA